MRTNPYRPADLRDSYGMDVSAFDLGVAERIGVGAAWGRVPPGGTSMANQHDETETWVIVSGSGEVVVDGVRRPVGPAMVIQFEPFETHFVENTGPSDLVFASFFWRDGERAADRATGPGRRGFADRPVLVFSSPPTSNGDLHLGHLSGPFFAADVYVRHQRMRGVDAWHLTGTDDFQSYVAAAARREGRTPAETAAHYAAEIRATLEAMDIEIHQYTMTSQDPDYPGRVQDFFASLVASGEVARRPGPALFDPETGRYLYEVDVAGGCPACGEPTSGNICESCREPNTCVDLIEPRASATGAVPVVDQAVRYLLPMHRMRDRIVEHHRLGRVPAAVKQLAGRVLARDRLDIALTHPAGEWGVPPAGPAEPGELIWVWVDVAYHFLHGIEALGRRLGRDWRAGEPREDWKIVHFLGSDGTFYHPVLVPALYALAHPGWRPDIDYNLNEFYLLEGSKFSTSRRHAIWGREILRPGTVDSVRLYLALTRPEGRRTNFERAAYEAFVRDVLIGTWQRWLHDLGARVARRYGGRAPDAGIWTPEHTAFLARLRNRLAAVSAALDADDFSLNTAARELIGLVADAAEFAERERPHAELADWADEARTGVALELAAARLLAGCAAPVMPRFAARLAGALGEPPPASWPDAVALVAPGTPIDLAGPFFADPDTIETAETTETAETAEPAAPLLPWLAGLVRDALRLPEGHPVHDRTLVELGTESLQAITLQYQISEQLGADVSVDDLLGGRDLAALADLIARDLPPEVVAAAAEKVRT